MGHNLLDEFLNFSVHLAQPVNSIQLIISVCAQSADQEYQPIRYLRVAKATLVSGFGDPSMATLAILVCIHNAHLAYMKLTERRLTLRMFVVELSEQLRGTHRGLSLKARRACTKSPTDVDSVHGVAFRTNGMHMPVPAPLTGTTKERGRIQCKLCMIIRQNRIDRKLAVQGQYRSIIMCDTCKVGLCCGQGNKNCFKVYHTVQALKNLINFQVVKD